MNSSYHPHACACFGRAVGCILRNAVVGFFAVALTASAAERAKIDAVQFYNRLDQPIRGLEDPESLMRYIVALNASLAAFLEEQSCTEQALGEIVVGLPPEGEHRIWLMKWDACVDAERKDALVRRLEAVSAPRPHTGPIAFVLKISLNGADAGKIKPESPDLPQEWKDALKGTDAVILPDGLPPVIWRLKAPARPTAGDSSVKSTSAAPGEPRRAPTFHVPPGYDLRDLGPAGGQVIVPRGWYFRAGSAPNGPVYTISKEDSSQGSYDTGLRIQLVAKVKATTGLTPQEAVRLNVERKKSREEVVDECPEEELGLFRRLCLETVGYPSKSRPQQQFHLIYSFWWNDEMDIMIAGTFGAPSAEWSEAAKVYAVIKDFKLIDLDRADAVATGVETAPAAQ